MCGIAGFAGVSKKFRPSLCIALSVGIDSRGGHAAGFLAMRKDGPLILGRNTGSWIGQSLDFYKHIIRGHAVMMHARYATTGSHTKSNAHPFKIERNGKAVLHGAHNGMILDADDSAKENRRDFSVDSRELFELLADNNKKRIKSLMGYGTIVWVTAKSPTRINFCRLTDDADLVYTHPREGGLVYASTAGILRYALKAAGMKAGTMMVPTSGYINAFDMSGNIEYTGEKLSMSGYPTLAPVMMSEMSKSSASEKKEKAWHGELSDDEWNRWLSVETSRQKHGEVTR